MRFFPSLAGGVFGTCWENFISFLAICSKHFIILFDLSCSKAGAILLMGMPKRTKSYPSVLMTIPRSMMKLPRLMISWRQDNPIPQAGQRDAQGHGENALAHAPLASPDAPKFHGLSVIHKFSRHREPPASLSHQAQFIPALTGSQYSPESLPPPGADPPARSGYSEAQGHESGRAAGRLGRPPPRMTAGPPVLPIAAPT